MDTTAAWKRSSLFDEVLYRFEKDYRAGKNPQVADYLSGEGEKRRQLLLELLHSDLELRLRAGEVLRVRDYLLKFPELAEQPADILSLLAVELRFLREQGQQPQLEQYEQEYGKLLPSSLKPLFEESRQTPSDSNLGKVIAQRYKLLNVLGQGGMGTVYLAEQTEPVKRQVALKLISGGIDSRNYITRFEAERQALAVMDHPNIARVYDGGTTDQQQPFFVMELVQGIPITQYCDQQKLNPKARLELFVQICQAVQHAHQKGIIHRDLKPGNVLVTTVDGKPEPKVIDFGLAKATEQPLTDETIEERGAVGTPAYMSPEQADPENMDVDTRTDVYALGVILYELLTGHTPIDVKQFRRGALLEMLRMVREVDPPRPSTKLSSAEELPSIAANRAVEPKELLSWVRGDIDWIVMKALEKDRNRRYETANGFAADIQRYLSGEAVLAHPPGRWYRVKKFVRRNRVQVVAAGLVVISLTGGLAVSLWLLNRAIDAEGLARSNEKLAEDRLVHVQTEKQIATAVRDFLQYRLLNQGDPAVQADLLQTLGRQENDRDPDPKLSVLLARSATALAPDKIEQNFPRQPLLQAELLKTVGDTYHAIGGKDNDHYALAIDFLQRAADLRKQHLGPDHQETLDVLHSLALAYQDAGQLAKALPLLETTLTAREAKLGNDHRDTLQSRNSLALAYNDAGQLDKALPYYEATLKACEAKLGSDHPNTLTIRNNLALAYKDAGQFAKALPLLEATLKAREAKLGTKHPDTLQSRNNLAVAYFSSSTGQLEKTLPLFEATLKACEATLGADHPDTLQSRDTLAHAYHAAGWLAKAVPLLEGTLNARETKLGTDHPDTLISRNNLALAYKEAGQFAKAVPLFEATLKVSEAKLGADHPNTLITRNNLAMVYGDAGQFAKALSLLEATLKASESKLGVDHPNTLTIRNNLALAYQATGQIAKALPFFQEASVGVERLRYQHMNVGGILPNTFRAYEQARQFDKADEWRQKWIVFVKQQCGTESPAYADELESLGLSLLTRKQWAKAENTLRECLAIREKSQGANPSSSNCQLFSTMSMLGIALLGQKNYAEAEPLLLNGYEGMKAYEKTIPQVRKIIHPEALDLLIQLYTEINKPEEVKMWQTLKDNQDMNIDIINSNWVFKHDKDNVSELHSWGTTPLNSSWQPIKIGKSWNDQGYDFQQGSVWYRLEILIPNNWKLGDYLLQCDGIDDYGELFLDGKYIGTMGDMYLSRSAFTWPAQFTLHGIRPGIKYQLAVRVVNLGGSGGIHRPITLSQQPIDLSAAYRRVLSEYGTRLNDELKAAKPIVANLYSYRENMACAHEKLNELQTAEALLRENVNAVKQGKCGERFPCSAALALAVNLRNQKKWAESEEQFRECLTLHQKQQPFVWRTHLTRALLGEVQLEQKKYAEAEQHLRNGYQEMKQRENTIPPQYKNKLPETLDRLIQLYTETNKPDEVKKWQAEKNKLLEQLNKEPATRK